MTVIRSFLILMSVFLLASIEQASAQVTAIHPAGISQPGLILAGDVLDGGAARACASNGSTAATTAVAEKGGSTPAPNSFAGRTGGRVAFAGAFKGAGAGLTQRCARPTWV